VPEIRRLLARLWVAPPPDVGAIWRWSRWRRRHQAIARHYLCWPFTLSVAIRWPPGYESARIWAWTD